MWFAIGLTLGLVAYDRLTVLLVRIAVKSRSEKVRDATREFAKARDIDTREKGRVVSLANHGRIANLMKGGSLTDALDTETDEPSD